jgi:hypothetical protein
MKSHRWQHVTEHGGSMGVNPEIKSRIQVVTNRDEGFVAVRGTVLNDGFQIPGRLWSYKALIRVWWCPLMDFHFQPTN